MLVKLMQASITPLQVVLTLAISYNESDNVFLAYHPKATSQQQKSSSMPIAVEGLDCI